MRNDLTGGSVPKTLLKFAVPYLIACFLQTFYGLTDLFVTGQFNGAGVISAVSIGSQITHMLTVMIVGLAMGSTVIISNAVGAKEPERIARGIGNTVSMFAVFSVGATLALVLSVNGILSAIATPKESFDEAGRYLLICFWGVPFIVAYNVLSSIFRGLGDSKSPMYFVAVAGVINIVLDVLFIGPLHMRAAGAALATVISQAASVAFALLMLRRRGLGVRLTRQDFRFRREILTNLLRVGVPVSVQDGIIQISFLVITAIANSRGVAAAAGVGIVEKIISFLFLVPSAMLSSISAIAAQNAGAGLHKRGRSVLYCGMAFSVSFGVVVGVIGQFIPVQVLTLFARGEDEVIRLGSQYLRSYVWDCAFASVHFCFSGYFCAYGKSLYSFLHNLISTVCVRVPGAYFASVLFPATLLPMGMAAPAGSFVSAVICVVIFRRMLSRMRRAGM